MSGNNIIRLNVDNSNSTDLEKLLEFNLVNSTPFIDNSFDYEVYIEKCELPLAKSLAIYKGAPIKLVLEATDKDDKPSIFTGDNLFVQYDLSGTFSSINDLIDEINEKIYYQLEPEYQWCYFSVSSNIITLHIANHTVAEKVKIWIDVSLTDLFEDLPIEGLLTYQGSKYTEVVFYKPENKDYSQSESKVKNFTNLKTFRLYSTLPTESYWLYDQVVGTMVQSNLLGEVVFNSKDMVNTVNLLYIPSVFRYSSLTDAGSIHQFRLWVHAYYFSGLEEACRLDKNSYASITLVFERKEKI